MSEINRLLKKKDVARILNVTERTVENYQYSGVLKYIKFGGTVRFREEDVRKLITRKDSTNE